MSVFSILQNYLTDAKKPVEVSIDTDYLIQIMCGFFIIQDFIKELLVKVRDIKPVSSS